MWKTTCCKYFTKIRKSVTVCVLVSGCCKRHCLRTTERKRTGTDVLCTYFLKSGDSSSGMWRRVVRWVTPDVSKGPSAKCTACSAWLKTQEHAKRLPPGHPVSQGHVPEEWNTQKPVSMISNLSCPTPHKYIIFLSCFYYISVYFKLHERTLICVPRSSVGIATRYGFDCSWIESQWG